MTVRATIEDLYRTLLRCWNDKDVAGYAARFADHAIVVGFDGTVVVSPESIRAHLESIFADHEPASYVAIVDDVRELRTGVALLRGRAGMVPPGSDAIKSEVNAQQTLLAIDMEDGWQIVLFQNTPARFDGRPAAVSDMTAALQAAHDAERPETHGV